MTVQTAINGSKKWYYKDLFDTRRNSVKQLWNNLSDTAALRKCNGTNNVQKLLIGNSYSEVPNVLAIILMNISVLLA